MNNKSKLEELLDILSDRGNKENKVENSEIFSLKEWESYSDERKLSIIVFIYLSQQLPSTPPQIDFDEETSKYLLVEGLKNVLKKIEK